MLPTFWNKQGYRTTNVKRDGKTVPRGVHRLVCSAWHGLPRDDSQIVDHINRCRSDNRPENLRWVTHRENAENRSCSFGSHGRSLVGFNENGEILVFSSGTLATYEYPKALALADRSECSSDKGYVFVDEMEWDEGIDIGVYFEQMEQARLERSALRRRYHEWLGVTE